MPSPPIEGEFSLLLKIFLTLCSNTNATNEPVLTHSALNLLPEKSPPLFQADIFVIFLKMKSAPSAVFIGLQRLHHYASIEINISAQRTEDKHDFICWRQLPLPVLGLHVGWHWAALVLLCTAPGHSLPSCPLSLLPSSDTTNPKQSHDQSCVISVAHTPPQNKMQGGWTNRWRAGSGCGWRRCGSIARVTSHHNLFPHILPSLQTHTCAHTHQRHLTSIWGTYMWQVLRWKWPDETQSDAKTVCIFTTFTQIMCSLVWSQVNRL